MKASKNKCVTKSTRSKFNSKTSMPSRSISKQVPSIQIDLCSNPKKPVTNKSNIQLSMFKAIDPKGQLPNLSLKRSKTPNSTRQQFEIGRQSLVSCKRPIASAFSSQRSSRSNSQGRISAFDQQSYENLTTKQSSKRNHFSRGRHSVTSQSSHTKIVKGKLMPQSQSMKSLNFELPLQRPSFMNKKIERSQITDSQISGSQTQDGSQFSILEPKILSKSKPFEMKTTEVTRISGNNRLMDPLILDCHIPQKRSLA